MTTELHRSKPEEVEHVIGVALDKPSLYMGGPSQGSRRKAQDVMEALDNHGYEVVKVKPSLAEASTGRGTIAWHEQQCDDIQNRWMRADSDPQLWKDIEFVTNMYRLAIASWKVRISPTYEELRGRIRSILSRFEAAVRMCSPDDMTPDAQRVFTSIIEDERGKA